jgi:MATE family multidrug resistance protein
LNHRTYLSLAIPLILSTITTPLLGAVDTAVVGQLSNPAYIGGVAIGTLIFNTMYWLFGFLRVSTSGFAAQAHGANNEIHGTLALARPFFIAIVVGILFILIQWPIEYLSMKLLNPASDVRMFASDYFGIRIWGAPFALLNYVILGWLIGMALIKASFMLQVLMNVMNIVLDLLFVYVFHLGVSGVAIATLLSEITAFTIGLCIIWRTSLFKLKQLPSLKEVMDRVSFKKMMLVNRDLFIRTLCLLTVFNLFTAKGASFGTETLAANAVLIQIHYIMAYVFDGFANATSILVGKAVGSKDEGLYRRTLRVSCQWAVLSSILISGIYFIGREHFILLFTRIPAVIELANTYSIWIILFPLSACFGLVLYGVFTGATEAVPVRNSMMMALILYLIVQFISVPIFNNHGLWLAFIMFSLGRSLFLAIYIPKLTQKLFNRNALDFKEIREV